MFIIEDNDSVYW